MGRKRSTNTNLPDRMRARKRTRKNGKTTVYYFYDGRDENGRRKEIPLGTDYIAAVQEWSKLGHTTEAMTNRYIRQEKVLKPLK